MWKDYRAYCFCFPTYLDNNSMLLVFPNLKIHHIFCPILNILRQKVKFCYKYYLWPREMIHRSRSRELLQRAGVGFPAPISRSSWLLVTPAPLDSTSFWPPGYSPTPECECTSECVCMHAIAEAGIRNLLQLTFPPYSLNQVSVKPRVSNWGSAASLLWDTLSLLLDVGITGNHTHPSFL